MEKGVKQESSYPLLVMKKDQTNYKEYIDGAPWHGNWV